MKKTLIILLVIAMALSTLTMVACDQTVGVVSISASDDTDIRVLVGGTVDYSDLEVVANYDDGSTKSLAVSELTIGSVDTSTEGEKSVTITWNGFSTTITVSVLEDTSALYQVRNNLTSDLKVEFEANIGVSLTDSDLEQVSFVNQTKTITAGDDNGFDLQLTANARNMLDELKDKEVSEFGTTMTFARLDGVNYTTLTETETANYIDSVDYNTHVINFSTDAVGQTFQISVMPTSEIYTGNALTITVTVVDGYNVYSAVELGVINNVTDGSGCDWSTLKEQYDLTGINPASVILQCDITVTSADVPADIFYGSDYNSMWDTYTDQTIEGSTIDSSANSPYRRVIKDSGDSFAIYGNYFQIDASSFPISVVRRDGSNSGEDFLNVGEGDAIDTVFTLFRMENDVGDNIVVNGASVVFDSVSFKGNGARSSDILNSGGMGFCRSNNINGTFDNVIVIDTFESFSINYGNRDTSSATPETSDLTTKYVIRDSKAFNGYSSIIYADRVPYLLIENCTFKQAGGPAIIATSEEEDADGVAGRGSYIDIVASTVQSYVAGTEAWFSTYGASSLVTGLVQGDGDLLPGTTDIDKTMLYKDGDVTTINLMVVMISTDMSEMMVKGLSGCITFYDTLEQYNDRYETSAINPYGLDFDSNNNYDGSANLGDEAYGTNGSGIFQSPVNGSAIYTHTEGSTGIYYEGYSLNWYVYNGFGAIVEMYDE